MTLLMVTSASKMSTVFIHHVVWLGMRHVCVEFRAFVGKRWKRFVCDLTLICQDRDTGSTLNNLT